MVAQTQKSGLLARISQRAKQVQSEVAKTPINYGNPSLPAGINNGIAHLDWIRFNEFKDGPNKGQLFMMAMGSVKRPTHHDDISIVGLKTSIGPIPLCDTKDSQGKETPFAKHWNTVLDEIAKVGDIKKEDITVDNMEAIAQKLTKLRPFFRFRTWQGKKQVTGPYAGREPKIVHEWNGRVEWEDKQEDDGMQDQGKPSSNGSNGDGVLALEDKSLGMDTPGFNEFDNPSETTQETTQEETKELTDEEKLEELITLADDSDNPSEEAQKTLQDMVKKAGVTEKELIDAASYREVVELMIKKMEEKSKKEEEPKPTPEVETKKETKKEAKKEPPKVGDTCKYQKNKTSKVLDCEVVTINLTAGIVNLKDLATETIHKGVKIENIKLD